MTLTGIVVWGLALRLGMGVGGKLGRLCLGNVAAVKMVKTVKWMYR
jgi:hypothetical protein